MVCATITKPNGDILNINFESIEQPHIVFQQFRVKLPEGKVGMISGSHQILPFKVVVAEGHNELFASLLDSGKYAFSMLWMGTTGHLVKAEGVWFLNETDPENDHVHVLYPKSFNLIFPDQEIR